MYVDNLDGCGGSIWFSLCVGTVAPSQDFLAYRGITVITSDGARGSLKSTSGRVVETVHSNAMGAEDRNSGMKAIREVREGTGTGKAKLGETRHEFCARGRKSWDLRVKW